MFKESSQRMIYVSISQMVNTWFRVTHVSGVRKSENIQMMLLVSNARKCMSLQMVRNKLPQHGRDTDFTAEHAQVGTFFFFYCTVMLLELSFHPSLHPPIHPSIIHSSIHLSIHLSRARKACQVQWLFCEIRTESKRRLRTHISIRMTGLPVSLSS